LLFFVIGMALFKNPMCHAVAPDLNANQQSFRSATEAL
jgi:hypothetical protein